MAKVINSKEIRAKKLVDALIKSISRHFQKHLNKCVGDIATDPNGNFDVFTDPILPKNNNKKL